MAYDYECTFDLEDCIKSLGLEEKGEVQQFITKEFMKNVEPYVPFDVAGKYNNSGRLNDSGTSEENQDEDQEEKKHKHMAEEVEKEHSTDVVWRTPYARRLYYHPEYNFQGGPMRGGYWANRYMQEGGREELEKGAREIVRRRGK